MKLTLIGGGGVRTPLFVTSALLRAAETNLDEIYLMDIDADRLEVISGLCRSMAAQIGSQVRIRHSTEPEAALEGAKYIVTSIRVGQETGRVLDERIALRRGVLGQETTGPGGFAMAMRSIPKILEYAALASQVAPGAWIFNFTNPAGLVTQALQNMGYNRVVGICDGANLAQHDIARWLQLPSPAVRTEVFGLNHLSWARRAWVNGEDILPGLLSDPTFIANSSLKVFEQPLLRLLDLFPNEYLYYYYHAEQALERILNDRQTRGEEVLQLNQALYHELSDPVMLADPSRAMNRYNAYQQRRNSTYMHYAVPGAPSMEQADAPLALAEVHPEPDGEGYAGVALDLIGSLETGKPHRTAVNVPNQGAIAGLHPEDVVEVTCLVENGTIQPIRIGSVPGHAASLMNSVKEYERLAVAAIAQRSKSLAVKSLMAHPLVMSYDRASCLVADYLEAHQEYVGHWS